MGILQDVKDFITSDDIKRDLTEFKPEDSIRSQVAELKDCLENISIVLVDLEKRLAFIEYHRHKPKEYR